MQTIGAPLTGLGSRSVRLSENLAAQEATWLLGLGVTAVIGQAVTRDHLQLPGHQGLVLLALLMVGRTATPTRWAATTTGVGAATVSMLPVWGFNDPFRWLPYLLVGALIDLAFLGLARWTRHLWLVALIGGIAYVAKPLVRVAINLVTGIPIGTVRLGVAYPVLTHFLFGTVGAAIGAGVILGARRLSRTEQP
jgi:hypothetical protein